MTVEVLRLSVPLLRPHVSAASTEESRESIVLVWQGPNGSTGFSECPTLGGAGYVTETTDQAWSALTTRLIPAQLSVGGSFGSGTPASVAAVLDAGLDSRLRGDNQSLGGYLGESVGIQPQRTVPWTAVLSAVGVNSDSSASLVSESMAAARQGASIVKYKIDGSDFLSNSAAMSDFSEIVSEFLSQASNAGLSCGVGADANGSLSTGQVQRLDHLGLVYLEQPLPAATSWEDAGILANSIETPIALDEAVMSLDAIDAALAANAGSVISIKPSRLGGTLTAARAVALVAKHGAKSFVGGMFELGIGRASALAVASLRANSLPTDLGPTHRYFDNDITPPVLVDSDGHIAVPQGPGIGVVMTPRSDWPTGTVLDRAVFE